MDFSLILLEAPKNPAKFTDNSLKMQPNTGKSIVHRGRVVIVIVIVLDFQLC